MNARSRICVPLTRSAHRALKAEAAAKGLTIGRLVQYVLATSPVLDCAPVISGTDSHRGQARVANG